MKCSSAFAAILALLALLPAGCGDGERFEFNPERAVHGQFSGDRALDWAGKIVALGPRPSGSTGIEKTRQFLEAELASLGWTTRRQEFDDATPRGKMKFVNVRARFKGGDDPWNRPAPVLIGSHYDTKAFASFSFVGANDGASGNALMLEMARVAASQPAFARQLELVFFDGEEAFLQYSLTDGFHGSRYYAQWVKSQPAELQPRAVLVFDMVGDRDLKIGIPPNSSEKLASWTMSAAKDLAVSKHFGASTKGEILDDHTAFHTAGFAATDIIDLDFSPWHTAGDTMETISAESLQTVGRVGLLTIEKYVLGGK